MKTVLFQGDSVTDCGRSRENLDDLACGYVYFASERLPGCRVINRGVSGNRAKDLVVRWEADCLALNPDVVSILIGVNDTWRAFDCGDPTSQASFIADCRRILEPLQARGTQVLLITPFITDERLMRNLAEKSDAGYAAVRADIDSKKAAVQQLAKEFETLLLDGDEVYRASGLSAAEYASDGVHPTEAGHRALGKASAEVLKTIL
jgi:lysophospholipase L1-like esterase